MSYSLLSKEKADASVGYNSRCTWEMESTESRVGLQIFRIVYSPQVEVIESQFPRQREDSKNPDRS